MSVKSVLAGWKIIKNERVNMSERMAFASSGTKAVVAALRGIDYAATIFCPEGDILARRRLKILPSPEYVTDSPSNSGHKYLRTAALLSALFLGGCQLPPDERPQCFSAPHHQILSEAIINTYEYEPALPQISKSEIDMVRDALTSIPYEYTKGIIRIGIYNQTKCDEFSGALSDSILYLCHQADGKNGAFSASAFGMTSASTVKFIVGHEAGHHTANLKPNLASEYYQTQEKRSQNPITKTNLGEFFANDFSEYIFASKYSKAKADLERRYYKDNSLYDWMKKNIFHDIECWENQICEYNLETAEKYLEIGTIHKDPQSCQQALDEFLYIIYVYNLCNSTDLANATIGTARAKACFGVASGNQENCKEALKIIEEAKQKYPSTICEASFNNYRDIYFECLKDYKSAAKESETLISQCPQWPMLWRVRLDLAGLYANYLNDCNKAIGIYKNILNDYPKGYARYGAIVGLVKCYVKLGDCETAKKYFDQLIQENKENQGKYYLNTYIEEAQKAISECLAP